MDEMSDEGNMFPVIRLNYTNYLGFNPFHKLDISNICVALVKP
jgi:hypothetical protein